MGKALKPQAVKLICGFIFKNESDYLRSKSILERYFGKSDYESPSLPFIFTKYYEKEMGQGLKRKFLSFSKLIAPGKLAAIKKLTNSIEKKSSNTEKRRINIDPGYLDLSKIVLASTKDFSHRIYLDKGIYAEVTLCYTRKTFTPWEWTYPDYRTQDYLNIFNRIRQIYAAQIR